MTKLNDAKKERIRELYTKGLDVTLIKKRLGCSHEMVRAAIDPDWAAQRREKDRLRVERNRNDKSRKTGATNYNMEANS
jgi:uncharacterized protein YjcR